MNFSIHFFAALFFSPLFAVLYWEKYLKGGSGMGGAAAGHLAAALTILVWSVTYISMKVLLEAYQPIEILFTRFFIGFCVLSLVCRSRIRFRPFREERLFMAAGFCGVTLYFLFENMALVYSQASNVGMIVAAAPMLTAIAARIFLREERIGVFFWVGFVCAMAGIALISFSGAAELSLNPLGDLLAFLGALSWAFYSVFTKKLAAFRETAAEETRHIFFYGLIFMIPAMRAMDFRPGLERLADPVNLFNILFLGVLASALCFATWGFAVHRIGAVRTAAYIYAGPVLTVACAAAVLGERITAASAAGMALTMTGLFISQWLPQLLGRRS